MSNSVTIRNLYPDIDVTKLCEQFGKFGRIVSSNIDYDKKTLISLCKGYICYDNPSSALMASEMKDKTNILGRSLIIKIEGPDHLLKKDSFSKVFVKNIDPSWDDCDLIKEFGTFGEISEAKVSETDGNSNGYGFVTFVNSSSAKLCIASLHGKALGKKKLIVQPYVVKALREKVSIENAKEVLKNSTQYNNLHVKNLPRNMTEDEFYSLFRPFGEIVSVKVERDVYGQSKGFGFVCFEKENDAKIAINRMNQYSYKSRVLEVNFCQKKAAREQYLHMIKTDSQIRKFEQEQEINSSRQSRKFDQEKKYRSSRSVPRQFCRDLPASSKSSLFTFSAKDNF